MCGVASGRTSVYGLGLATALVLGCVFPAFVLAADRDTMDSSHFKLPIVPRLHGEVFVDAVGTPAVPPSDHIFDNLDELDKRVTVVAPVKRRGIARRLANSGTSLANFILDLRGFDWSKEGANVALDENVNPKCDSAKEYLHRCRIDQLQLQTVSSIMQLAEGLGAEKSAASKAEIETATDSLRKCVGAEEAADIICALMQKLDEPRSFRTKKWTLQARNQKLRAILEATAQRDPVAADLKRRLAKYNHRSKFVQISAKVVYSTLGIASFSPTLVAPVAETAVMAFMMATGGPEQDKLLKELYLAKCLESRVQLLNEQAHLLVDSYETGVTTDNSLLAACSKSLLTRLASPEVCDNVFSSSSRSANGSNSVQPGS